MDWHDRPLPGSYDESRPVPPAEYLSQEPHSPGGSGRRTIVISAAAAVLAAAVTAGGVLTLTGRTVDTGGKEALTHQGAVHPANAGPEKEVTSSDPDDASFEEGAGEGSRGSGSDDFSGSSDTGGSSGYADRSGGQGDQPDHPAAQTAVPIADTQRTENRQGSGNGSQGAAPDGRAGYVDPYPQRPDRLNGLGADFFAGGPTSEPTPSPTAKPTSSPTAKPSAKPSAKPTKSPTKSTPSPTATGGASALVTAEDEVARLTSAARQEQGCGPLRIDEHLRAAARGHSDDMAAKGYFDHNSQDGRTPWDRMKAAGYKSSMFAENIARGQASPAAVVKAWLESPGHRANIMNCKLKAIGVGVHFGSGGPWWTQDFGAD